MDDELLEICGSIYEVMRDAKYDIDKIYNMDLNFEDSIIDEIIHQRDEILKSLIAELLRVHKEPFHI